MKYEDELKKISEQMGGSNPIQGNNLVGGIGKMVKISLIAGLIFTIGIGALVYFVIQGANSYIETELEQTASFSGDPTMFDPVARYDEVHAHAGEGTLLTEINASLVKSDGTLDLMAQYKPAPHVIYTFYRVLDEPPEDAPPTGADHWYQKIEVEAYEPGQRRHVTTRGGDINLDYIYYNKGLDKEEKSPTSSKPSQEFIDPPSCSFGQIWAAAIEQGASPEYVANMTYDEDGYEFVIRDATIRLKFDRDCQLIK